MNRELKGIHTRSPVFTKLICSMPNKVNITIIQDINIESIN